MRLSISMILLVFLSSCGSTPLNEIDYSSEINTLTTVQLQKEYLEEVFRIDQKCRTNETDAQIKYGNDSPEHLAALEIMNEVDGANIAKLELYIEKYGHPTTASHGETASMTPWIVIHHSDGSLYRQRYFPHLYKAFRLEDIDEGAFTMYMGRWHHFAHGHRLKLPSPYRSETEVDTLIKAMSMQKIRLEIDKELSTIQP